MACKKPTSYRPYQWSFLHEVRGGGLPYEKIRGCLGKGCQVNWILSIRPS